MKSVFLSTSFTSSTFPIQPDFSQNQLAAITLNTGSPRTLVYVFTPPRLPKGGGENAHYYRRARCEVTFCSIDFQVGVEDS